ncbi:type VI secretion system contractile sheath large subunit, partial [Undibacterium seohonense]
FSIYHWTAAIHGIEDGGLVENLPLYQYQNMSGMTVQLCPTTVPITDRRANELTNLGFIPLCHCKGSTHAAFISANTCFIPKKYFD